MTLIYRGRAFLDSVRRALRLLLFSRPRRLLVLAKDGAAAKRVVGRLRPDQADIFALGTATGLEGLADRVLPIGCPEEESLRIEGRELAETLAAELTDGLPMDPAFRRYALPLALEDHLFGPLRVARAVDTAVSNGAWDAVAIIARAAQWPLAAAALEAARARGVRAVALSPTFPSVRTALPAPFVERAPADTVVVVRGQDKAYLAPAQRVAETMGAVLVSTARSASPEEGLGAGPPPPWLAAAMSRGHILVGRQDDPGVAAGLRAFLANGLADIACQWAAAEALLETVRPRRVLAFAGRDSAALAVVLACGRRGIPTLDVQVLLQSAHPRYRMSQADVFCALTEDQRRLYRSLYDTGHQRIERLGSLRMPALRAMFDAVDRPTARAEAGIPAHVAKVILMVGQPGFEALAQPTLDVLAAAVGRAGDAMLVVKPHPREERNVYERLAERHGALVRVVAPDCPIYRLLKGVDAAVTYCSNVGIEACVLGVPVIAANLSGRPFPVDLVAMGVARAAETPEALAAAIDAVLTGEGEGAGQVFLKANPEFLGDPLNRLQVLAEGMSGLARVEKGRDAG